MAEAEIEDIGTIMNRIANPNENEDNLSVYNLMNEWFNPRQSLMKHVIVIQMIACVMVGFFLIIVAGDTVSPNNLMLMVMGFMIFVAAAFGVYSKL